MSRATVRAVASPVLVGTGRPLPGVWFGSETPVPDALPRTDVAAFVGFASAGPVDVPVVIEDLAKLTEVFGEETVIAGGPEGDEVRAQLVPAVRAFLRNGGKRCWAVRVTGRFTGSEGTSGTPARFGAAAPWFRSSAVRARFPAQGLVTLDQATTEQAELRARAVGSWSDGLTATVTVSATSVPLVADSLRKGPGQDTSRPETVYCRLTEPSSVSPGDLLRVHVGRGTVLLFAVAGTTAASGAADGIEVTGTHPVWVSEVPPPDDEMEADALHPEQSEATPVRVRGNGLVTILCGDGADSLRSLATGSVVRVQLRTGERKTRFLIVAGEAETASAGLAGTWVEVSDRRPGDWSEAPPVEGGEVLTAGCSVREPGGRIRTLDGLGLVPGHPRYLGDLPTDEQLFGRPEAEGGDHPGTPSDLWEAARHPRFPLAGAADADGDGDGRPVLYPLGGASATPPMAGPRADSRPALERDGLTRYREDLFLDPRLSGVATGFLLESADFLCRQDPATARPPVGAHALLALEEVALVAVPDAVHGGWETYLPGEPPPPPPYEHADDTGATRGLEGSAGDVFSDCVRGTVPPPPGNLRLDDSSGTTVGPIIRWDASKDALSYVLEEGSDPQSWQGTRTVFTGSGTSVGLPLRRPGTYFYRVRARGSGGSGDWSGGFALRICAEPVTVPVPSPARPHPVSLAVHRALLSMCAARGDMLAVLSLPKGLGPDAAALHVAQLRGSFPGDERTPSFAGVFHPWPLVGGGDGAAVTVVPPDGPMAGLLAARSLQRGDWVAPCNQRLVDVVGLAPAWLDDHSALVLQNAHVNALRSTARGVVCLGADTLSADTDLGELTVRRLLSLLRRVMLQTGQRYVMEPAGPQLRRTLRRGCEAALTLLLRRGAFAGTSPRDCYRISVRDRDARTLSGDEASVVVEIAVAPTVPLRFLTVRLVQFPDRSLTLEGVAT
ncbi:hypothetical protein [Streptomyces sp. NPDC059916]|uniref:hypothetical protein n=1 Tax=Streptomyces sp. NPDC059916 TaxID=3347001 RepID=UPI0036A0B730